MTPSVLYNFDASSLALKILADVSNAQLPNGLVPDIAPEYARPNFSRSFFVTICDNLQQSVTI